MWGYWGEPFAKEYLRLEGSHQALRIASGMKKAVEVMPIALNPEKVIVGEALKESIVSFSFGGGINVNYELAEKAMENCNDEKIKQEIQRTIERFENEDTKKKIVESMTEDEKKSGFMHVYWAGTWGGHTLLDYSLILGGGTTGLREKINGLRERAYNKEEKEWIESLEVTCDAMDLLSKRYADAASEMKSTEKDPLKYKELEEIERICRKVPRYPAETFREALQSFWFTFVYDGIDSPGRFDQYMYPYLRNSLDSGELSMIDAQELLEKLWLRFEEVRAWNLCVGGVKPDGSDATNELSYMILEAARKYKFEAPNLTMRCHSSTPERLWDLAVETIKTGIGMPALYNDSAVIPAMGNFGIYLSDARNYAMNGCNQIDIQGKSHMGLEDGELDLIKCLDLALNRGYCSITGEKLGIDTGDPLEFKSFDDLMEAYKKQVSYFTDVLTTVANKSQRVYAEHAPNPFRSLLIEGCMEKLKDFREGGPVYNHGQILTQGIGNTADSLAAVKKLVYEDKIISMGKLLEALKNNFQGFEKERKLLSSCSHYGNDDSYSDSLASEIVSHFFTELMKYKTFRGGIYGGGSSVYTRGPRFGANVGATPDGRLKGEPLADSVGPVQGRDLKGPTAVLNSVSKVDQSLSLSGYVLNLKLDKTFLKSNGAAEKFQNIVKTFFKRGGQQVQVNVLDARDLIEAKKTPEKYKNLVVRVGGFSAYFVELEAALQDDIIKRTSHVI